jgi:hypothetical protein
MTRTLLLFMGLVCLAGCQAPSLYEWGNYEPILYVSYRAPDQMPPERQAELLEADVQKAAGEGRAVAPGVHAHLGYAYFQLGRMDAARQELETEKRLFPESTVFMNRLVARLNARAKEGEK